MINKEKIVAAVGFINTGVALASHRFYQDAKIPVINNVATGTALTKGPSFPFKDAKDVFSLYFAENENNFNLANILGFNKLFYGKNSQYIAEESPNCNIYDNLYLQVYLNNIPINKYETSNKNFSYY